MTFSSVAHAIHFSVWEMLYVISVVTEPDDIVIWITEIESMLRSENVSSSQLEQSHGGTEQFVLTHITATCWISRDEATLDQSRLSFW